MLALSSQHRKCKLGTGLFSELAACCCKPLPSFCPFCLWSSTRAGIPHSAARALATTFQQKSLQKCMHCLAGRAATVKQLVLVRCGTLGGCQYMSALWGLPGMHSPSRSLSVEYLQKYRTGFKGGPGPQQNGGRCWGSSWLRVGIFDCSSKSLR